VCRLCIYRGTRAQTDNAATTLASIYIVEDDADMAARVCLLLGQQGHQATWFDTPHKFFYQLSKSRPDAVVVDWMLPEMSGIDVVVRIRQLLGRNVGVLMLTALDSEDCVVNALKTGADDYVVKPGADAVLLARVDALLRRTATAPASMTLVREPYRLDYAKQSLRIADQVVALTPREFELAWTLFSQPSRLFTKEELQAAIWGKDHELGHNTLMQHIYQLRRKLQLAQHGARLLSVYGSGYRLELATANGASVPIPHA
jgi:DNA-binding response OmpR family regulator